MLVTCLRAHENPRGFPDAAANSDEERSVALLVLRRRPSYCEIAYVSFSLDMEVTLGWSYVQPWPVF